MKLVAVKIRGTRGMVLNCVRKNGAIKFEDAIAGSYMCI
jgi:hypothetical protein